jgi:hypothetical protein
VVTTALEKLPERGAGIEMVTAAVVSFVKSLDEVAVTMAQYLAVGQREIIPVLYVCGGEES